jgi:hypothetical protein
MGKLVQNGMCLLIWLVIIFVMMGMGVSVSP